MKHLKKIELLAPAGNFEALKAAVEAGADAVYLAGSSFGARAYAGNFSTEELIQAVKFAHLRGVAVHVTVNTIVADSELKDLENYLNFLEQLHVDAILVQDLGVAALAKKVAPNLILHASTQMTVHSLEGIQFLEELGFSRVVLAREMTIPEIQYICANSNVEIEIFMHGALCVCYSGQCLMSSMIGARSGNRGRCAQPCRLPYELVDESGINLLEGKAGKYLLSPKDINTLNLLPKLIDVGVDSLKIEGRMKRPEYVAVVVETYRAAIDDKPFNEGQKRLAQIFNRDFTSAYLESNPGRKLISDTRPNNRGVLIGRVAAVTHNSIAIKTGEIVNKGDQLEIWVKVGGRVTITVDDFSVDGDICTLKTIEKFNGIKIHDRVFKIFDAALTEHARSFFTSSSPVRRIAVDIEVDAKLDYPLKVKMIDSQNNVAELIGDVNAVVASGKPLDSELIKRQLSRLGNTIYELRNLNVNLEDNIMIPISELNEIRRRAVSLLDNIRLKKFNAPNVSVSCKSYFMDNKMTKKYLSDGLIVAVEDLKALEIAVDAGANAILFGGDSYHHNLITAEMYRKAIEIAHTKNCKLFISTPRIVRQNEQTEFAVILEASHDADAIYVHNVATLHLAKKISSVPIHTDYSLISFNSETLNLLYNLDVVSVTLSPELTLEQIKTLVKSATVQLECIVHGRLELMISQYCAIGSFLGGVGEHKCKEPCKRQKFYLRDRKKTCFPIVTDQFCRMHVLNSKVLSILPYVHDLKNAGIGAFRIDGRYLSNDELVQTVQVYRHALNGDSLNETNISENLDFTRGHYFRGVIS